jgi:hypothetical protein
LNNGWNLEIASQEDIEQDFYRNVCLKSSQCSYWILNQAKQVEVDEMLGYLNEFYHQNELVTTVEFEGVKYGLMSDFIMWWAW